MVLSPLLAHGTLPANSTQLKPIDDLIESAIIQRLNYRSLLWRVGKIIKRGTHNPFFPGASPGEHTRYIH